MARFKRNQVEEAISAVLQPRATEPTQELRTRVKRLLEIDRALGRVTRSSDPEHQRYAFYTDEPPGSGVEVWFSEFEAFALLNGLRLMQHGLPQSDVVSIVRRVRPELEQEHSRVLTHDRLWLFDEQAIRERARPGDMAFDNQDPVLLVMVSAPRFRDCAVRPLAGALRFATEVSRGAGAWTMFELTTVAWRLSDKLTRTEPRSRGRSS